MSVRRPNQPLVCIRGLTKTFGGQTALSQVDLDIMPGEIHALVGQNGSGKSTLIKVLAGYHVPDAGEVAVGGEPLGFGSAAHARAAGIRFVHQDLGLVDSMDTVDNLALGVGFHEGQRRWQISWKAERRRAAAMLRGFGYDFDVRQPLAELSVSEQAAVAIVRAMGTDGEPIKLLVLDEPTAPMSAFEVRRLANAVKAVRDGGTAVLFVSHRLAEVFDLADRITVIRDGAIVMTVPAGDTNHDHLVERMLGRALAMGVPQTAAAVPHPEGPYAAGDTVLDARGLGGHVVSGVDLAVRAGETVGVAGIAGSGRDELAGLLWGAMPRTGTVSLGGEPVKDSPESARRSGIGFVPANRKANGIVNTLCVRENLNFPDLGSCKRSVRISRRQELEETREWLRLLGVQPADPEADILTLSGGNQQKVVLGRALRLAPKVLVLDEPTQGVDLGAKEQLYALIRARAAQGMAVVVCSSDSGDLVALCDRVLVFREGRVSRVLQRQELTVEAIDRACVEAVAA
ncbi:MAG TPA: sugar ABC transporter ATP-binding protein [Acidimicrobiales bacterium]|nr:sugar ABC transporter ATP-binding protein [Acidimicrobiales bacterium]